MKIKNQFGVVEKMLCCPYYYYFIFGQGGMENYTRCKIWQPYPKKGHDYPGRGRGRGKSQAPFE
jgi:hypothetical protein